MNGDMQEEREWRTRSDEAKGRQKMRGGRQGEGKNDMTAIEIQKHTATVSNNYHVVSRYNPDKASWFTVLLQVVRLRELVWGTAT